MFTAFSLCQLGELYLLEYVQFMSSWGILSIITIQYRHQKYRFVTKSFTGVSVLRQAVKSQVLIFVSNCTSDSSLKSALCSEQLKWRIIHSDGWLSARSDWTILRADQFPASLYCCWWWVTPLIITRESMPWILFSLPAHWHGDAATLLHRCCMHTCITHSHWHALADQPYYTVQQHKLACIRVIAAYTCDTVWPCVMIST